MNLKYYLRGLGIGIIVTAVIMLVISSKNTKTLTDEEIKQKARALGMVEQETTLISLSNQETAPEDNGSSVDEAPDTNTDGDILNTDESVDEAGSLDEPEMSSSGNMDYNEVEKQIDEADAKLEEIKGESVSSPEPTPEPTKAPEPTPEPTKAPEPTPEPTKAPENEQPKTGKGISFDVNKGEGSYTVAKNLAAAGFISDASSFDSYLCSTGMDRKIYAGTYTIPEGSTEEEIAKILTGH